MRFFFFSTFFYHIKPSCGEVPYKLNVAINEKEINITYESNIYAFQNKTISKVYIMKQKHVSSLHQDSANPRFSIVTSAHKWINMHNMHLTSLHLMLNTFYIRKLN